MIILERFEGDWAVLEMDGKIFQVPQELVPEEAREGMCLAVDIVVDDGATEARAAEIRKLFDQFF